MSDTRISDFEVNNNAFLEAVNSQEGETEQAEDTSDGIEEHTSDSEDSESSPSSDRKDSGDAVWDDDTEDEEEEGEDPKEDEDGPDDDSDEEEEGVEATSEDRPVKRYKATLADGSQVELADDTTLKMKVDGRFERVSVADLKKGYNGTVKHDELIRRTSEAEKQANAKLQGLITKAETIQEKTKGVSEAITSGNVMDALMIIAEIEGSDPNEVMTNWVGGLTTFLDDFEKKSPEERAAQAKKYKMDAEIKAKKQELERLSTDQEKRQAKVAIKDACEANDLTKDELNEAYTALNTRNEKLKQAGESEINFTLNDVVSVAQDYKLFYGLGDAAEDLSVELDSKEKHFLMDMAKAEQRKNGTRLGEKDFVKLIHKYIDKEVKTLNRKVGAAKTVKTTPKRKKKKFKEIKRVSQAWDV